MIKKTMPTYNIILTNQNLEYLHDVLKKTYQQKPLFIITDKNVYDFYQQDLKQTLSSFTCHFIVVEPGERSKSLKTYHSVINSLMEKGIKRDHFILAFGGGVVGDLAGFVAATLFRGMRYAQVPTSLLAQVDSSIGGKVALDLEAGKNLVGAFYDPCFVFIDTHFLKTLPKREKNNGLAEIIKAGLIKDKALFDRLVKDPTIDETLMAKALDVKRDLVLKDPYDQADRMLLNFGHTFGHAIEKAHQYETYKHGEAISYGMLMALQTGMNLGITPKDIYPILKQLLLDFELITEPLLEAKDYLKYIKNDKKNLSDGIRFILLEAIGKATWQTLRACDL